MTLTYINFILSFSLPLFFPDLVFSFLVLSCPGSVIFLPVLIPTLFSFLPALVLFSFFLSSIFPCSHSFLPWFFSHSFCPQSFSVLILSLFTFFPCSHSFLPWFFSHSFCPQSFPVLILSCPGSFLILPVLNLSLFSFFPALVLFSFSLSLIFPCSHSFLPWFFSHSSCP